MVGEDANTSVDRTKLASRAASEIGDWTGVKRLPAILGEPQVACCTIPIVRGRRRSFYCVRSTKPLVGSPLKGPDQPCCRPSVTKRQSQKQEKAMERLVIATSTGRVFQGIALLLRVSDAKARAFSRSPGGRASYSHYSLTSARSSCTPTNGISRNRSTNLQVRPGWGEG